MIDRSKSKYREKHWFLSRSARATRIIIDASIVGGNAPGKQPVGRVSGPSFQLSSFLSAAMKSFEWDATTASGNALQPLVMASCIWNPSFQINSTYASVRFPDQEGSSYRLLELYDERTWNHYSPSWFAPPEDMKHSLLGVFPHANEVDWAKNPPPNSAWTNAHGCTIDAYWNQARYELPSSSIGPPTIFTASRTNSSYRGSLIEISPSFAYSKLSTMDWYWADSPPSDNITLLLLDEINSYGEVMLALSLFNILQTYPASFSYEDSYSSIPANNVVFPFEIVRTVYGYETASATVVLSLMVLGIYSLLSLVYMLFILVTGRTSTAWSSAAELCTLALQSRKPDHLGHVGVGIETMATFKEGVFIRINKNNEPELLFKGDRDVQSDGNSRLELNKAY
ncbi:hypothetical protein GRF29_112g70178 [Pseudopithomyces chartarum]|uniref:Uncharacterized protein n=1 Tax=Pseudopithomyces chartarum TaxID=1892770 RepID=A0AAN6LRF6_9PLEO|nr:hypothetical protein GRF29_112g70178 [Pseudopithomyces chartarum]